MEKGGREEEGGRARRNKREVSRNESEPRRRCPGVNDTTLAMDDEQTRESKQRWTVVEGMKKKKCGAILNEV